MKQGILFLLVVLASSFVSAAPNMLEKNSAEKIVQDYKNLRRACAITQGDERRKCFSQLSSSTEAYKQAKQQLASNLEVSSTGLAGQLR